MPPDIHIETNKHTAAASTKYYTLRFYNTNTAYITYLTRVGCSFTENKNMTHSRSSSTRDKDMTQFYYFSTLHLPLALLKNGGDHARLLY